MAKLVSVAGQCPVFAQTMLRIRDPIPTKAFYTGKMGMTCVAQLDFEELDYSLYYFAYTDDAPRDPAMSRADTAQWLWSREYPTLEMTHNWGTENDENFKYNNGNSEPKSFGHIGVVVDDIDAATVALEDTQVTVVRAPGPFKDVGSISFVSDPDGYWIELINRTTKSSAGTLGQGLLGPDPVFAQTMVRVKDPVASMNFYRKIGFQFVNKFDFPDLKFSLYFMAYTSDDPIDSAEAQDLRAKWQWDRRYPTLELTHNHGTEDDADFRYNDRSEDPLEGFGHIGCIVDDVRKVCEGLEMENVKIVQKPGPFMNVGEAAFVSDADGYRVKLINRTSSPPERPYVKPQ